VIKVYPVQQVQRVTQDRWERSANKVLLVSPDPKVWRVHMVPSVTRESKENLVFKVL
jgi:hypothetical protein